MLPLRLSPLLLLLLPAVPGNSSRRTKLIPRLELSQFLQNVSWQRDPRLSMALRQSVLEILERRAGSDLLRRRRVPFRPFGDLQASSSFSAGSSPQKAGILPRAPIGDSSRQAESRPKMRYEKGRPHIYERRSEKGVDLFCSVAFQAQVSIFWTLNGKPLEDYDSLSEETVPEGRISTLSVKTLSRLPTKTGVYTFNCTTLTDYDLATVHLDVLLLLSDKCGGHHDTDCSDRIAVCRDKSCVCEGYYKVRLDSVHVTCRSEAFLETPCMYDEQCLSTSNHSECIGRGWCACHKGYGRTEEQKCVPKVGARSRCNSEDECADYDSTCILNHCTCFSHKKEIGDRCVNIAEHMKLFNGAPSAQGIWSVPWVLLPLIALLDAGVCA